MKLLTPVRETLNNAIQINTLSKNKLSFKTSNSTKKDVSFKVLTLLVIDTSYLFGCVLQITQTLVIDE